MVVVLTAPWGSEAFGTCLGSKFEKQKMEKQSREALECSGTVAELSRRLAARESSGVQEALDGKEASSWEWQEASSVSSPEMLWEA